VLVETGSGLHAGKLRLSSDSGYGYGASRSSQGSGTSNLAPAEAGPRDGAAGAPDVAAFPADMTSSSLRVITTMMTIPTIPTTTTTKAREHHDHGKNDG